MQGKKFLQKKTEIKTCLQSKGYTPPPESVQNSNADQRQLEYPIPPPESVQNSNAEQRQSEYPIPPPLKVCKTQILTKDNQNILASPLGPMAHVVRMS